MIHEAFPQMTGIRSVRTDYHECFDSVPKAIITVEFNDGECYRIEVEKEN